MKKKSIFGPNIKRIIRFKSNKFFWGAIENFMLPRSGDFYFMHKEGSTIEDDENYRDPTGFVEIVEFSPSSTFNTQYKL